MTESNLERTLVDRVRRLEERIADVQRQRATLRVNMRDLRDANLTKASNGQVPEYNELTGRWDPVPGLATKAALAGATFTGGVSVQGATTDAASGVRRVSLGASASQTPRLILENSDSGGTRWALTNTNSELQVWEFTSGTSKMTLNTLGDMTLIGNLPARGPTKRGGITQDELDAKVNVTHIIGIRHATVNQTLTVATLTNVNFGNSSSVGNIDASASSGTDIKILQAGHYHARAVVNFSGSDGAGGSALAGERHLFLQVIRAGAVFYEETRTAYAATAAQVSVEVQLSQLLEVNDRVRLVAVAFGSNVRMDARLTAGKPTTQYMEVAYDHAG